MKLPHNFPRWHSPQRSSPRCKLHLQTGKTCTQGRASIFWWVFCGFFDETEKPTNPTPKGSVREPGSRTLPQVPPLRGYPLRKARFSALQSGELWRKTPENNNISSATRQYEKSGSFIRMGLRGANLNRCHLFFCAACARHKTHAAACHSFGVGFVFFFRLRRKNHKPHQRALARGCVHFFACPSSTHPQVTPVEGYKSLENAKELGRSFAKYPLVGSFFRQSCKNKTNSNCSHSRERKRAAHVSKRIFPFRKHILFRSLTVAARLFASFLNSYNQQQQKGS